MKERAVGSAGASKLRGRCESAVYGAALVCAAAWPLRLLPLDTGWLDILRLPAMAFFLFPFFGMAWAILQFVPARPPRVSNRVRQTTMLVLLVVWAMIGVGQWQLHEALLDLDEFADTELRTNISLNSEPQALVLPSPYTPSSQRSFWRAVSTMLEWRRLMLDLPIVDSRYSTARLERANARLGAGEPADAELRAAGSAGHSDMLTQVVLAKSMYARGDTMGARDALDRASEIARGLNGIPRTLASARIHQYRSYVDASLAAAHGDMPQVAAALMEYSKGAGMTATLACVGQDPAFVRFRASAEYAAFVSAARAQ